MAHEIMISEEGVRIEDGELHGVKVRSTFNTKFGVASVPFDVTVDLSGMPLVDLLPRLMSNLIISAQRKQGKFSREEAVELWRGEMRWEDFLGTTTRPSAKSVAASLSIEDLERILAEKLKAEG